MRVYATELICSTGVLGFHTFKLALCIYNKLRSHAEILSWWAFDVTFPGSNPLRSNRSGLNVSNGGSWNPKFILKVNSFWIKIKGQNFASQVLSRHKKRKWFFWSQGHLNKKKFDWLFIVDPIWLVWNTYISHWLTDWLTDSSIDPKETRRVD